MGVASGIGAWIYSHRQRVRMPLITAGILQLLAAVITVFLDGHSPAVLIIAVSVLVGASSGSASVLNQTALCQEAPAETVGTAAGLMRTFGYVGSIVSATIIGLFFDVRVNDSGLHRISLVLIGVGLAVLVLTLFGRQTGYRPVAAGGAAEPPISGVPRSRWILVRRAGPDAQASRMVPRHINNVVDTAFQPALG
jgi:sugar phosphate permease